MQLYRKLHREMITNTLTFLRKTRKTQVTETQRRNTAPTAVSIRMRLGSKVEALSSEVELSLTALKSVTPGVLRFHKLGFQFDLSPST